MTEHSIPAYEDDEISLIDILVTLAESWKLLVFGPLIAGVLAGGLSLLWPKTFESVAIVRMTEEEVALLHVAPVLDPLIEKFGLLAEADGFLDDARQGLKKRLTFAVDKKTKLATITAKARTPDLAHALGHGAIAAVLKELQVKGQDKVLMEKTIEINSRAIASAEDAIESIQRGFKRGALSDQAQESAVKNLAAIYTDIAKRTQENETLRQKLDIKGVEIFVQQPSLPQRKTSPKRSIVVLQALLASGFALMLFVFIRKAWRNAEQDAESAAKVAHIKQLLGTGSKL
jgi:LPS O-antigen subunit length determinant protein (WzzB/FepE family)